MLRKAAWDYRCYAPGKAISALDRLLRQILCDRYIGQTGVMVNGRSHIHDIAVASSARRRRNLHQ
jgi:hypothetical protein